MRRQTGPSDIQPDQWEPSASTCDDVQGLLDALSERLHDRTSDETFIQCLACGQVDGHSPQCFVPLMERWVNGEAHGFTIHLTGEQGFRLRHCLDVTIAGWASDAKLMRENPAGLPLHTRVQPILALLERWMKEAREIREKV